MLQQHGIAFQMSADKQKTPTTSSNPNQSPVINNFDEKHRKFQQGIDAACALAAQYRSRITTGGSLVDAARELSRYVRNDLKDEPVIFAEAFINALDGRTDGPSQSVVYQCMKSTGILQKRAGIYLIVCLAETHSSNVIRYANYLLKMLNGGGIDEQTIQLASKALAFLITTCKTYAAELVDRCLDHCQEWLHHVPSYQPPVQNQKDLTLIEQRRLASAHLSREIALATPTAFFLRVNLFFKYIFFAIKDKQVLVRLAGIDALHTVLTIVSQREAKNKTEWFKECFSEALTANTNHQSSDIHDKWHSVALILNELLRISDSRFEMVRCESSNFVKQKYLREDEDDGVEWLCLSKQPVIVESVTSRKLVVENFSKIIDCVRQMIPLANKVQNKQMPGIHLNTVLMQLLPRICAFPQSDRTFQTLAYDTAFHVLQKNSIGAPALGMMMLHNPDVHSNRIEATINFISAEIKKVTTSSDALDSFFTFLFLFVDSYHEKVTAQIKAIIPQLMDIPLSRSLANVLKMIMMRIPKLRLNVQDGVMASVYHTLTGLPIPPKSEPTGRPPSPKLILQRAIEEPKELQRIVLAVDVLGEFYFSRGALQRIMQYVADYYLTADNVEIRLAAVSSCCEMVVPFVGVYKKVTTDKRNSLLQTIYGVLRAVCSVIVNDPDVRVRMQVISCFGQMPRPFLAHLAQPEMLEVQFMALHDEKLEMQQACVTLLGRLAELNPALVLPRLRLMLLETLSQMMQSGQARLEQHSAKMIAQLAKQSPKFMRPYVGSLMVALIPKMRNDQKYAEVTAQVLHAISEISVIGGAEIVKNLKPLFEKLTHMINDSSNLHKREAALRAIGGICRSTAYVVDPYRDYPTLLDDLLRILKTVMSNTMRREVIKTLGILGAIDPYTHKVFTGSVQSATAISTALSLPMNAEDSKDPRQDIIHWFNYEKCTLDEFYPAITIANLMIMMQDEDSQNFAEIAQAIVTIFRSLGEMAPLYTEQVVPRLIEVCRKTTEQSNHGTNREFFLQQLAIFVAIIKKHAAPYMPAIFTIIADAWKEDISVKMVVIQVLTEMGTAIGNDFSKYTGELIPYLLTVLQTDKTKERVLTVKVMESIRPLTYCIVQHLHLVLPPILIILDDISLKLSIRQTALDTVLHMTQQVDVSAYAPRMMQSWHHNIKVAEMRDKLLLLLIEIIKQLGKFFDIFKRGVDQKLREHALDKSVHYETYRKLAQRAQMSRDVITSSVFAGSNGNLQSAQAAIRGDPGNIYLNNELHERLLNGSMDSANSRHGNRDDYYQFGLEDKKETPKVAPTTARSTSELVTIQITKQRLNKDLVMSQWKNEHLTSKDEWLQWLVKIRIGFLKSGSSPSLRAASSLGDQYPHLARDLFPAAFMSVWTELDSEVQKDLTACLLRAISTGIPELIQTILNLAEFMDHSEKGPLPITHDVLGMWAEQTKAFAKACRYKEMSVLKSSETAPMTFRRKITLRPNDCQSLITYANKLNVQEEAAGVVRYAERNDMNFQRRGRWYEKLNEWEKALDAYMEEKNSCTNLQNLDKNDVETPEKAAAAEEAKMHEMRCLEALARWDELNAKSAIWAEQRSQRSDSIRDEINKKQLDHKMAVIAARGAWAVDNWERMAEYVSVISENTQDGAMLRAVVAVHNDENTKAMGLIEKVREMIDSELTAMANESYERAYIPMVSVQQMAELEEAIEYKTRPERRPRIALLWSRRLQGCRRNVEQWQRLIMLRGLVLSPQEMHPLRVKFASMCRKQGKSSMSRAVLRELLSLPANADLMCAKAPYDKPLLVLALAKQLYQDEQKDAAIRALEELANHWNKRINPIPHSTGKEMVPPSTKEPARICAKVLLKLGEWTEHKARNANILPAGELSFVQQQVSPPYRTSRENRPPETIAFENTINFYQQAAKYDPDWHKVWHKLASTHFYAVCRERPHPRIIHQKEKPPVLSKQVPASKRAMPVIKPASPPPPAQKSPQPAAFHSSTNTEPLSDCPVPPPLGSLIGLGPMPNFSSPSPAQPYHHHPSPLAFPSGNTMYLEHAAQAVTCFSKALMTSPGSRLEDTLRLMQLWFDFGDHDSVYYALSDNIFDLPVTTWLEAIPQLMARLDCPHEQRSVQLVLRVLGEIAKHRPQAIIYALTVASRSSDEHRSKNAHMVLDKMMEYHSKLVGEAKLVTEELVRCAILWHEQWHDALDDASRVYFHRRMQDNNVQAMFDALRNMNEMMQKGAPTTMKEHSFQQTYSADLKEAGQYVIAFESSGNVKDLNQAWEIYCAVFKKLRDQLATLNSLDLVYVSPNLVSAKDLELVVPGTYDPSAPIVSIQSFSSKMSVITSKQRPRKMMIRGSNGLDYQFLLKGHEDPRQDERVMQLFGLVNTLLANNSETCRRNLTIQRYSIVALSKDSGLIGWVPNCDTLHTLVKEYREKKAKIPLSIEHKTLQKLTQDTERLTTMQKLQCFESALAATQGEDLRQVLWLKSPSSEVWFDRRTNYTRSVACMSMVGYILGLGDRHPSNLMLDRLTGKIVHIDFGDCFEVAMLREKFPERVPFRLTRMLINAMEVTGLDGVFNYTAERVLKMLRTNQESLLAVLEAFVYDPVINWRLVEGMKKDPKAKKEPGGGRAHVIATVNAVLPSTSTTDSIMETIKRKLDGTEFAQNDGSNPLEALAVADQLALLVEQATSSTNLCQSYIGWCPFWAMRRARIQIKPNVAKAAKQATPAPAPVAPKVVETVPEAPAPEAATPVVEDVVMTVNQNSSPDNDEEASLESMKSLHVDVSKNHQNHVHFTDDVIDHDKIRKELVTAAHSNVSLLSPSSQFATPHPPGRLMTPRSRNVSMCEDESILQPKQQREKKRFSGKEELDTKTWKMSDLTRWNPRNEMTSFKRERRSSTSSTVITKSEIGDFDASPRINAPQVKIGADGRLVIDETSLVVQSAQVNHESVWETVEEGRMGSKITSMSFRNRISRRPTLWSERETDLFYEVLQCTGTDFGLMHHYLPQRSRPELKSKYNREEKNNWARLLKATSHPTRLDGELEVRIAKVMAEIEDEAQEKKANREFEKEEERKVREQIRLQKAAERTDEKIKKLQARELVRKARELEKDARIAQKLRDVQNRKDAEREAKEKAKMDVRILADEAKRCAMEAKKIITEKRKAEAESRKEAKVQAESHNLEREAERIIRRLIQESQREERRSAQLINRINRNPAKKKGDENAGEAVGEAAPADANSTAAVDDTVDPMASEGEGTNSESSESLESSDEEAVPNKTAKREKERMKEARIERKPRKTVTEHKPVYVNPMDAKYAHEPVNKALEMALKAKGTLFDSADEDFEVPEMEPMDTTPGPAPPPAAAVPVEEEKEEEEEPVPQSVTDVIEEIVRCRSKTPVMEEVKSPSEDHEEKKKRQPKRKSEEKKEKEEDEEPPAKVARVEEEEMNFEASKPDAVRGTVEDFIDVEAVSPNPKKIDQEPCCSSSIPSTSSASVPAPSSSESTEELTLPSTSLARRTVKKPVFWHKKK
ncbi:hypothetical protein L5515_002037 [Caenorhabditis briggsae]|uniref:non-specific serine/threonine protein kinase n=2 Tax=Caenorhabditis briggsae TaxID=6238 RepID=A0AAE9E4Q6_CAEBR|nr:hypothetical protein L5515_002037 [Caenorhabditis briggsae]